MNLSLESSWKIRVKLWICIIFANCSWNCWHFDKLSRITGRWRVRRNRRCYEKLKLGLEILNWQSKILNNSGGVWFW